MNELYEQKLKRTRMLWITAIVTGIIVILGVTGFFLMRYQKEKTYSRYINEADQYFVSEQYDEAITSYKKAIKIDKSRYRPYEGAGQSYIEMERYSEARVFLQEGIDNTGSQELEVLYDRIKDARDGVSLESMEAHPDKEETIVVDNTMVMNIGSYTYKQYTGTYGEGTVSLDKGTCVIRYDKLNAKAYYENSADASIINRQTGKPFDGQVPTYLVFNDLSAIFPQWDEGITFYSLQKLVDNTAEVNTLDNEYRVVFQYMNCRFEVACDEEGNINDITAENKVYPLAASASDSMGTIVGNVIDAKTGAILEEVTVKAIDGTDSETGRVIQETVSDSNGEYSMQIPEGEYTIEFSKEGYVTSLNEDSIKVNAGSNESVPQKVLMPNLSSGEWSIVLTWDGEPNDLDLHLFSDDYHVSFHNKAGNGKNGDNAVLDVDDTDGYGPETITITQMQTDVKYDILVDNYSYRSEDDDNALAESNAVITLYSSTGEQFTYSVPNGKGNLWHVLTIENGDIKEVNDLIKGDVGE